MIKIKYVVVTSGICPKCKVNSENWFGRICPNCGYIGKPIQDE